MLVDGDYTKFVESHVFQKIIKLQTAKMIKLTPVVSCYLSFRVTSISHHLRWLSETLKAFSQTLSIPKQYGSGIVLKNCLFVSVTFYVQIYHSFNQNLQAIFLFKFNFATYIITVELLQILYHPKHAYRTEGCIVLRISLTVL